MVSLKKEFIKTAIIGFLIAGITILFLYYLITKIVIEEKIQQARLQVQTMISYRHYLAMVAPKVKIFDHNISPFSLTPAFVTNKVAEMLREKGYYIKQTSDNYRNILDKPNETELKAINFFKKHKDKKEFYAIHSADKYFNQKHVFYSRKLIIEKSCLKCHGVPFKDVPPKLYYEIVKKYGNKAFNYHLGDVRGIISIVFPYKIIINKAVKFFVLVIGIGIVFFIIGLFIFYKLNENINRDILKILNHFKKTKKGQYPILKEKMKFFEFENLKNQINKTFKLLKKFQGETYKKYYFDSVSGLPNRNKFLETIKDNRYIVVLFNVDKFKDINFYFGMDIANELIKEISLRLRKIKKLYNVKIFHIDVDEFAVLFSEIDKESLIKIVKNILKELEKPYKIKDNDIIIRFRAGICYKKKNYIFADIALEVAKDMKKDFYFGDDIKNLDKYKEHLEWLKNIKLAFNGNRIRPFFQPIVDKNKKIIKYEALVRLIDEEGNIIPPLFFLDVAKKSRLYLEITKRVIEYAVNIIEVKNIGISVNITYEDMNNKEMREYIFNKLKNMKNKKLLAFEIVETEDVGGNEKIKEFISNIKNMGCEIYIDDFGSGYSNFDYLIKLNPDGIKIDGSLIKNILTEKNSEIIVKTIISFAKEMNIKTIAEFVENEKIFEKLKKLGVDYFQGNLFSPPKPDI